MGLRFQEGSWGLLGGGGGENGGGATWDQNRAVIAGVVVGIALRESVQ